MGQRAPELVFLLAQRLLDGGAVLVKFGVVVAQRRHHAGSGLGQEGFAEPKLALTLQHGAANQTAEHIAPARVARQDAIRNAKSGGAQVVGHDAQGAVLITPVLGSPKFLDTRKDRRKPVRVVHAAVPAQHSGGAFQAHARVHAGEGERRHARFAVALVLRLALPLVLDEHVVPYLQPHPGGFVAQVVLDRIRPRRGRHVVGHPVEHL